jgi:peroxiredoxin
MVLCPKCLTENPQGSAFCNACSEPLAPPSPMPTAKNNAPGLPNAPEGPRRRGMAIASLVLGILACVSSLFVVGALFGLIGLILGLVHVSKRRAPNGMAWWGVGLSTFGILVSALMVIFVIYTYFTQRTTTVNELDKAFDRWIGVEAPDIELKILDGTPIRLSQLKGKMVILNFWATWCGTCTREVPDFVKLYHESSRDDLIIIGLTDENADEVRPFIAKKSVAYPIALTQGLPSPYQDIKAIPTTFFINRDGIIQNVCVGPRDFNELKERVRIMVNDEEDDKNSE